MIAAIENNYLGLLKFGFAKQLFTPKTHKKICQIAIKSNNFECLQLLITNNCKLDKWCTHAATENPDIKFLKYIYILWVISGIDLKMILEDCGSKNFIMLLQNMEILII